MAEELAACDAEQRALGGSISLSYSKQAPGEGQGGRQTHLALCGRFPIQTGAGAGRMFVRGLGNRLQISLLQLPGGVLHGRLGGCKGARPQVPALGLGCGVPGSYQRNQ